jgi:hypothetical protein
MTRHCPMLDLMHLCLGEIIKHCGISCTKDPGMTGPSATLPCTFRPGAPLFQGGEHRAFIVPTLQEKHHHHPSADA